MKGTALAGTLEEQKAAARIRVAAWRKANPKRNAANIAQWRIKHPTYASEYDRKKRRGRRRPRVDAAKDRAYKAVYLAIKRGHLVRGPCEHADRTCLGRIEAHHDDYSKPLKVRWLCKRHHTIEDRRASHA